MRTDVASKESIKNTMAEPETEANAVLLPLDGLSLFTRSRLATRQITS